MTGTIARSLDRRALLGFLWLSLSVVVLWTILLRGWFYTAHPSLAAFGVAFDLAIVLPAIWYLLAVRRGLAAPATLVPIAVAGLVGAHVMTPGDPPPIALALAVMVELGVAAVVVQRVRLAARRASPASDPIERIEAFAADLVPSRLVAGALTTEIVVLWHAFFSWKQDPPRSDGVVRWAKVEDWAGVTVGLLVVVVAEAIGVHLWLMTKWPNAVWLLTALDLYAIVWIVADARALGLSAVRREGDVIDIRFGLRWHATVPVAQVESIEGVAGEEQEFDLRLALVEAPDTRLTFREPVSFRGPYGIRKSVRNVGLLLEGRLELPPSDDAQRADRRTD